MITIDTTRTANYSPLIPAIKAIYTHPSGQQMEIIMAEDPPFQDLKEFLAEQGIGFREIYDGERKIVQFTIP